MILKKNFFFKSNYLIILLISFISFAIGIFFHDAKVAYFLKQAASNKTLFTKNLINSFIFNDISELKLDIPFKTRDYLEKNLITATKFNDLSVTENRYKRVEINFQGKKIKARARLKGLTNFHRLGEKKSLKLKIIETNSGSTPTVMGFSRFNLMDPKRRSNEKEWLFRKVAKDEGILERRYDFIKVKINGDSPKIYSIEENFSKEFFEYNKIKPSPIISLDSDKTRAATFYNNCCGHIWVNDFNFSPIQSGKKIFKDKNFNSQYTYAKKKLFDFMSGNIDAGKIINLNKFAKFLALTDIFGGWHGSETSNLKLYFNPYNKLLEPIPDDVFDEPRNTPTRDFALFKINNIRGYSVFYEKLFNSNEFLKIYYQYLRKFSEKQFIKSISEKYQEELKIVNLKISNDDLFFESTIIQRLEENSDSINKFVNPNYPLEVIHVSKNDENFLELDLQNNFYFPINLKSLIIHDKVYQIDEIINPKKISLNSVFEGSFFHILKKPKRSKIKIKVSENNEFIKNSKINYSIGDNEIKTFTLGDFNPVELRIDLVSNIEDFKDQINFDKDLKKITIIGDKLKINKNLIFPKDYQFLLNQNVDIIMHNDANLIIESDIFFEKEKNIKVNFIAKGNNCIIFKKNKIEFKKVFFDGFSNCQVDGNYLTGGVNFYKTKINADTISVKNNKSGDDLINIIKSEFQINNFYLESSLYDALDIDYSKGNIVNLNCFDCGKNVGGDGVDLSFSDVFFENMLITNSSDKGLSIGENTNLNIRNLKIQDSNVCVANKDGSYTKIINAVFERCKIGLAAFNKKSYYDTSRIQIANYEFIDNGQDILRDEKNKIVLGSLEHNDPATIDQNILNKIYE